MLSNRVSGSLLAPLVPTLFATSAMAAPGDGWTLTPLLLEGDAVVGVGAVTRIDNLAVNDLGQWQVEADTDNSDTNGDSVLVRNGVLFLQEGQSLATPIGALLDSFDSIELNDAGDASFNHFLDGTSGSSDDSGIYFNDLLLIQEGDSATSAGFSSGTNWIGFFETKLNDSNQMLVLGSVDDPAINSSVDRALVRLTLNPDGSIAATDLVVKEGDVLLGATEAVQDAETNPHALALGDDGLTLWVADLEGDTIADGAICIENQILFRENDPSPIPGRPWESFGSTKLDRHPIGGVVFTATVQGDNASDAVIVQDNTVFQQEGGPVPGVPGATLASFGSGPVQIGASGRVLWFGSWNETSGTVEGLFLGEDLVVQTGVTQIAGQTVVDISGVQDGYRMSDDGKRIIFEAELADGRQGAFLAELQADVEVLGSCTANLASMSAPNGGPTVGQTFDLAFDTAASTSAFSFLATAPGLAPLGGPCGLQLPEIGEVVIDFTQYQLLELGVLASFPTTVGVTIPDLPSILGKDLFVQALLIDLTGVGVQAAYLSNGLRVCFGI
jgi:hypothetical protein